MLYACLHWYSAPALTRVCLYSQLFLYLLPAHHPIQCPAPCHPKLARLKETTQRATIIQQLACSDFLKTKRNQSAIGTYASDTNLKIEHELVNWGIMALCSPTSLFYLICLKYLHLQCQVFLLLAQGNVTAVTALNQLKVGLEIKDLELISTRSQSLQTKDRHFPGM